MHAQPVILHEFLFHLRIFKSKGTFFAVFVSPRLFVDGFYSPVEIFIDIFGNIPGKFTSKNMRLVYNLKRNVPKFVDLLAHSRKLKLFTNARVLPP